MQPRPFLAALGPSLLGAAYALSLVAYEHRGVSGADGALCFALAWAAPLGVALGATLGALATLRRRLRGGRGAPPLRATVLLLVGWHLASSLWAMAAQPAIASEAWYGRGGARRLVQVLAADVAGPRTLAVLGTAALALYAIGASPKRPFGAAGVVQRLLGATSASRPLLSASGASPTRLATLLRSPYSFGAALLALAAATLLWLVSPSATHHPSERPNLVLVGFASLDAASLGPDVVPSLASLAEQGVTFDQAVVSTTDAPLGRAVWASGVEAPRWRLRRVPAGESLPERLVSAGYRVAVVGDDGLVGRLGLLADKTPVIERWPLALEPLRPLAKALASRLGLTPPTRRDLGDADDVIERALRFADVDDGPFAIAIFLPEARPPFAGTCRRALAFADRTYRGRCKYRACSPELGSAPADDEDVRQETALRQGALACDDDALGHLLEGLRARGIERNTLVAAFGEGGATMPRVGSSRGEEPPLDDRSLVVPLIVRGPGVSSPSRRHELVSDLDLAPTVAELLGLPGYTDSPGRSLARALRGEPLTEAPAFSEAGEASAVNTLGRRWALSAAQHRLVAQATRKGLAFALFDRRIDPEQTHDRAAEAPNVRDALRDELLGHLLRDPALTLRFGHVVRRPPQAPSPSASPVAPKAPPSALSNAPNVLSNAPSALSSAPNLPSSAPNVPSNAPNVLSSAPRERQSSLLDALQSALPDLPSPDVALSATVSTLAPDPWARPPSHPARRRVSLGSRGERDETRSALVVPASSTLRMSRLIGPGARLRIAPAPLAPPERPLQVEARVRRPGARPEVLGTWALGAEEARGWVERELDLGRFSGLEIELELRALPASTDAPSIAWGSPTLVEASATELLYNIVFASFGAPADTRRASRGATPPNTSRPASIDSTSLDLGRLSPQAVWFPDYVAAATSHDPELLALLAGMRSGELGLGVGTPPSKPTLDAFYARRPPLLAPLLRAAGATTLALRERGPASSDTFGSVDLGFDASIELDKRTATRELGAWIEQHRRERFFVLVQLDAHEPLGLSREGARALDPLLGTLRRLDLDRETIVAASTAGGALGEFDAPERFLRRPSPPLVIVAPNLASPNLASSNLASPNLAAGAHPELPAYAADLAPTLLALEGLAPDARMSGRALLGASLPPTESLATRARVTEGRGARSLRSGPFLYVERDARGASGGGARSFLFDAVSGAPPRDHSDERPEMVERLRDDLAREIARHQSAEATDSEALAGSRFTPPPPSPRARVALRFYGGPERHRVTLRIDKPAPSPGEIAPSLRLTAVGLDPSVLYDGPSFVDAAFMTRPDLAAGFDIELAPSTTPLSWHVSWDDRSLEPDAWLAGPFGLGLPGLSEGLRDEATRRFAEGSALPADLAPGRDEGVLVLWQELDAPP